MNGLIILAEAAKESTGEALPMDFVLEQITGLDWLPALLAMAFGSVYLLYGWRIFKVLAVVCFGMLGMFGGIEVGETLGSPLWGGVAGLILVGAISILLMRWAVSILGAVAGGALSSGIWFACGFPDQYIWAGTAIGFIAGGMISFIVFKISVMLFTSLGGGLLVVVGFLSLLYHYEKTLDDPTNHIETLINEQQWFFPVLIIFATTIGMMVQNKFIKDYSEWEL